MPNFLLGQARLGLGAAKTLGGAGMAIGRGVYKHVAEPITRKTFGLVTGTADRIGRHIVAHPGRAALEAGALAGIYGMGKHTYDRWQQMTPYSNYRYI